MANEEGRRTFEYVVATVTKQTSWDKPRTEHGEAAWLGLKDIEQKLEDHAWAIAQELPSAEWLFFLRQAPHLFDGWEPLTPKYIAWHAETISALSAKPARVSRVPGLFDYGPDPSRFSSIFRLRAIAFLLAQTQNLLRCAGKGCVLTSRPGLLPAPDTNPALDEMTSLWDQRMANAGWDFLSRAGLYSRKLHAYPSIEDDAIPIAQRYGMDTFRLTPLPLGAVPTLTDPTVPTDLRYPQPVLDLMVLLIATNLYLASRRSGPPMSERVRFDLGMFSRSGTAYRDRTDLISVIETALKLIDEKRVARSLPDEIVFSRPGQIVDRLLGQDISLWPPSGGPAIRSSGGGLVVTDLYTASQRLEVELARPAVASTGALANKWARGFEAVVQEAIDATAWRPSQKLAQLRGRHLKTDRDITDLDAIGEYQGQALLVSCKAIPFSEAWQRGDYKACLNVAAAVNKAVADWEIRIEKLRTQPVGANYDLSGYNLVGVIVLPQVPWTANKASTAEVAPGLRIAVSASEFDRWLNQGFSEHRPR